MTTSRQDTMVLLARGPRRRSASLAQPPSGLRSGQRHAGRCRVQAASRGSERLAAAGTGRGRGRRASRRSARPPPASPSPTPTGEPMTLAALKGKTAAGQSLGDLVRALPARRCRPSTRSRRRAAGRISRRRHEYRHAQPRQAEAWLLDAGVTRLPDYATRRPVFQDLRQVGSSPGMPTTFCSIRRPASSQASAAAEWASEDALRLVRAALGRC